MQLVRLRSPDPLSALSAYLLKAHKLSHPNLINKAKRQTIPSFMEKGVWMIGG